jgi:hypothetical protein
MARDPVISSPATLYNLQQPEKLSAVLEQDKYEDCLACRLTGAYRLSHFLARVERLIHLRRNCFHRSRCLQLLLRPAPAPPPPGCHSEKWLAVRNEVATSRNYKHCVGSGRTGSLAVSELKGFDIEGKKRRKFAAFFRPCKCRGKPGEDVSPYKSRGSRGSMLRSAGEDWVA